MEGLVLFLVFVAVCACVFLVMKVYKRMGELQEDMSGLMRIPMGQSYGTAEQAANVTPSGMPLADGREQANGVLNGMSEDDLQKIIRMVQESQGGK